MDKHRQSDSRGTWTSTGRRSHRLPGGQQLPAKCNKMLLEDRGARLPGGQQLPAKCNKMLLDLQIFNPPIRRKKKKEQTQAQAQAHRKKNKNKHTQSQAQATINHESRIIFLCPLKRASRIILRKSKIKKALIFIYKFFNCSCYIVIKCYLKKLVFFKLNLYNFSYNN